MKSFYTRTSSDLTDRFGSENVVVEIPGKIHGTISGLTKALPQTPARPFKNKTTPEKKQQTLSIQPGDFSPATFASLAANKSSSKSNAAQRPINLFFTKQQQKKKKEENFPKAHPCK